MQNPRFIMRNLFGTTFKGNPYLERGLMAGITRVAKESIFSDLNNLEVVTSTSEEYGDCFGFTQREVSAALEEFDLSDQKEKVRDEQIVFSQLGTDDNALWSFLLASGYLKVLATDADCSGGDLPSYTLALTNGEVRIMFRSMVKGWFAGSGASSAYQDFMKALISDDVESMNFNLNRVTQSVFSFFDTGGQEPERFYHGFVLGLMVYLDPDYFLRSNRESGRGRYDVVLEPKYPARHDAILLELKVREAEKEKDLGATVKRALEQIEEKQYDRELLARGFTENQIRKYGFAFEGKTVFIGS